LKTSPVITLASLHAAVRRRCAESLDPRSRTASEADAKANDDVITRIEITVDDIDDHGFLERPIFRYGPIQSVFVAVRT
jgi:hypothetical protein